MARPNQATQRKKNRERSRQEWQQEKQEKRASRTDLKKERDELVASGVDPDLMGIVAGPQPVATDL